jgi:hypothetical protein
MHHKPAANTCTTGSPQRDPYIPVRNMYFMVTRIYTYSVKTGDVFGTLNLQDVPVTQLRPPFAAPESA